MSDLVYNQKHKIHYPFKWIQLVKQSNYLNINSCLHLSNKLKEFCKFFSCFIMDSDEECVTVILIVLKKKRKQKEEIKNSMSDAMVD